MPDGSYRCAADIDAAARRISGVAALTPLEECPRLSAETATTVLLKREDLQVVRSYKLRGAFNLMAQLTADERAAGVVCASAGNHAQGVAFACRALDIKGRIYLPNTTPRQKRDRILSHGGRHGRAGDDRRHVRRRRTAAPRPSTRRTAGPCWSPPFDDRRTIAGQGTVVRELLQQLGRAPDVIVVPVGGGGLIAGIVTYLSPSAPPGSGSSAPNPPGPPSMMAALAAGGPVRLEHDGPVRRRCGGPPDRGAAVRDRRGGRRTGGRVDEGAICTEMLRLYQNEGIVAEPAGALAVAALPQLDLAPGSTVVALITGGNNDVSRYGEIVERSLVHLGLKHYFLVDFPQEPGALRRFLDEVLGPDDDITLFEYVKRNNRETGPALVGVEIGSADGLSALLARMAEVADGGRADLARLGRVPLPDLIRDDGR